MPRDSPVLTWSRFSFCQWSPSPGGTFGSVLPGAISSFPLCVLRGFQTTVSWKAPPKGPHPHVVVPQEPFLKQERSLLLSSRGPARNPIVA